MTNFGIYEKALISNEFEKSLKYAHENGYTFWEISIDNERKERLYWNNDKIKKIVNMCLDLNMPIYNMVLSIHRDYPLGSKDSAVRNQGIDYLYKAIELAVKLGVRTIQIAGYYTTSEHSSDGSKELFISSLKKGAKYASAHGVMIAIENMDYDLISANDIKSVINEVNSPYVKCFLDVGNFVANGLDPVKELEKVIPHLVGLHLKESKPGVYRRVDFGSGNVPFNLIFKFLGKCQYDGYLGVEMWNDEEPNSLKKVSNAIEWLKDTEKYK